MSYIETEEDIKSRERYVRKKIETFRREFTSIGLRKKYRRAVLPHLLIAILSPNHEGVARERFGECLEEYEHLIETCKYTDKLPNKYKNFDVHLDIAKKNNPDFADKNEEIVWLLKKN